MSDGSQACSFEVKLTLRVDKEERYKNAGNHLVWKMVKDKQVRVIAALATACRYDVGWILDQIQESAPELLAVVFTQLAPFDLASCCAVCRVWRADASADMLWRPLLAALLAGKVHEPMALPTSARLGYFVAKAWYKRTIITEAELCSYEWNHRMKEAAGEHFIERDPWWQGKAARQVRYKADGSSRWLGNPFSEEEEEELAPIDSPGGADSDAPGGRWRFITPTKLGKHTGSNVGFRKKDYLVDGRPWAPRGSCVRWCPFPGMSEVPTMHVRRHANGGFILDACWHVQTSFPMPHHREVRGERLHDDVLDVTVDQQHVEARAYNSGAPLPCLEDLESF